MIFRCRKNYFKQIKFMCKENKLKEFYFKLAHRILVSKKELHLFGVSNNSDCTYCGQPDSITHTFIDCHLSKQFFHKVLQYFNEENGTSFTQSDEELIHTYIHTYILYYSSQRGSSAINTQIIIN